MTTPRRTALTVAEREFENGETLRDQIPPRRRQDASCRAIQVAIHEGLVSGITDRTILQIAQEAEARLRRDGRR